MDAIMNGEAVIQHDGRSYTLAAGGDALGLLLPTAKGTYTKFEHNLSRTFHLQEPLKEMSRRSSEHNKEAITFTASRSGESASARRQPDGLRSSWRPFGPASGSQNSPEHQSSPSRPAVKLTAIDKYSIEDRLAQPPQKKKRKEKSTQIKSTGHLHEDLVEFSVQDASQQLLTHRLHDSQHLSEGDWPRKKKKHRISTGS